MSPQDGRTRILDAALRLFAERGAAATTVRDIAAAAEVSPANVLHHFGSKDGLREAVDAHVETLVERMVEGDPAHREAIGGAGEDATGSLAEMFGTAFPPDSPLPAYLRRLILDHDARGAAFVSSWIDQSERLLREFEQRGTVRPSDDSRARAAFVVANDLALLLLREQLTTALGTDPLSPEGMTRWAAMAVDTYTHGLYADRDPHATATEEETP